MDSVRWQRINRIFAEACDAPAPQRRAVLLRECAGDDALRTEIDSLLVAHDRASSFLEGAACVTSEAGATNARERIVSGARIGRFVVQREIGRGGMGLVFEAEQESPRRRVALKFVRSDRGSADLLRRFHDEAQALARVQHPGIAQVFEAGEHAADGLLRPYLAMELVDGAPITTWVRTRSLSLRRRIELLIRVCAAVEHAHQRGVIHRDLKPSNILVTADGQPKVLDFGVARLLDTDAVAPAAVGQTEAGQLIGTPAYMSPEQIEGDAANIDTRADIYALGVIAFEVLLGRLPIDVEGKNLYAAATTIRDQAVTLTSAERRAIPADLHVVLLHALEKQPAQRYPSAGAFADDLQRVIDLQPIRARPPSSWDSLRKWVARNKLAAAAAGGLVLVMLAATVINRRFAIEASRQRDVAQAALGAEQTARKSADETVAFLESLFAAASPNAGGKEVPDLRQLMREAVARLPELDDEPLVQARLMTTLGGVLTRLADFDQARDLLYRALDQRKAALGDSHPDLIDTIEAIIGLHTARGEHAKAQEWGDELARRVAEIFGSQSEQALDALEDRAAAYFYGGDNAAACEQFAEILRRRQALHGEEHLEVAQAHSNLGVAMVNAGKQPDAIPHLDAALATRRRLAPDRPDLGVTLQSLGQALHAVGRRAEALQRLQERVAFQRTVVHAKHPTLAEALMDLAFLMQETNAATAEPLVVEALRIRRELGEWHPALAETLNQLGLVHNRLGRGREAAVELAEALRIHERSFGPADSRTINVCNTLSRINQDLGDFEQAEQLIDRVVAGWTAEHGPDSWQAAVAHQNKAGILLATFELDAADGHLAEAGRIFTQLKAANLANVKQLQTMVAEERGDFESAERLCREALTIAETDRRAPLTQAATLRALLGAILCERAETGRGTAMLTAAVDDLCGIVGPDARDLIRPRTELADALQLSGESDRAAREVAEALRIARSTDPPHPRWVEASLVQATIRASAGDHEAAIAAAREAVAALAERRPPTSWRLVRARARLAYCLYQMDGKCGAECAATAAEVAPLLRGALPENHQELQRLAALAGAEVRN